MCCAGSQCYHVFVCVTVIVTSWVMTTVSAKATIEAVAPLNPVREGDIMSLRCQVWNLAANQAVKISRHSSMSGSIVTVFSYNKGLLSGMDERVFLAVRQLRDGSTVYFLSIIDVRQEDEGLFVCKVMDMTDDRVIAKGAADIKTMFFPSDSSPRCDPSGSITTSAGRYLQLNCSSEKAHPPVKIEWTRAGTDQDLSFTQETTGSTVYSVLTLKPTYKDRDAMYLCTISSIHFPDQTRSCHVGPLMVVAQAQGNPIARYYVTKSPSVPEVEAVTSRVRYELGVVVHPSDNQRCEEICRRSSLQSIQFWVICTATAALFAIVFFIIGVIILIKYRNTPYAAKPKVHYVTHHQGRDDVYTELELRQDANKVYMAITKPPDDIVYCPNDGHIEDLTDDEHLNNGPPESRYLTQ